ncbi:MAG: ABC transporter ATP-binding protein [Bilifractor sp.]|jgi:ATP-binding cassette subfamily B multidrug efflux pump
MRKIRDFVKSYQREAILAPLFKLLEACMDLAVPMIVALVINKGIASKDMRMIFVYFAELLGLCVLGLVFSIVAQYFAAKVATGTACDLRQALFDHIQSLSYHTLDEVGADTLITRMTSDINMVQNGLNLALRLVLRSPFIVLGACVMAFIVDVKAGLVFAAVIPLLALVIFLIMMKSIPLYTRSQKELDRLTLKTRENLTGVRVIRAFGKEKQEVAEYDAVNEALTRMNEKVGRLSALLNPLTYFMIQIATIVLVYVGALRVNSGALLQGDVVALYNYMAQIVVELIKFASLMITINRALACGRRIEDVLALKKGMDYGDEKAEGHEVVFDHVSMRYEDGGELVLDDICCDAHQGETIGVIGGTGAGKSSLVQLIGRFYDISGGSLTIDGRDIRSFSKEALRQLVSIVPQKPMLFAGTIRENLKLGKPDAEDEELLRAVRIAQADSVLTAKGGLDGMIEQNGRNLSGGQRQRLTIARALVCNTPILILDDSASALDFATEAALRMALAREEKDKMVWMVSQRASSLMHCRCILVLQDGKIVGKGTHQELLKTCSVYQEICASQGVKS